MKSQRKKIGLVGGISWTSTLDYYRLLNEETNRRLGGLEFAETVIDSVNFAHFAKCNAAHDWEGTFQLLSGAAQNLRNAGADVLLLGANTAHIVAERVAEAAGLPLIDIRVVTATAIQQQNLRKVALLGTAYTMQLDFYKDKLSEFGIEAFTPKNKADINFIEETLLHELGKGVIRQETKQAYVRIASELLERGAEGLVLGCTEIPLLLGQADFSVPVFNTTHIHVRAAVEFALSNQNDGNAES